MTEQLFALGVSVIGLLQVGLLTGIFFRLGGHHERLADLEDDVKALWKKLRGSCKL